MKDRDYAEALNARIDGLMDEYWKRADKVYNDVLGSLK